MKKTDEVRLYIDGEQVGACEKIRISENIAELKNLDYNDSFKVAFQSWPRGEIKLIVEDSTTMKRFILLGCTKWLLSEDKFPREDYYSKLFRLTFKNKKIKGIKDTGDKEEGCYTMVRDMTGDMSDDEFEEVVAEVAERIRDQVYSTVFRKTWKVLDKFRAEMLSSKSFKIKFKFDYTGGIFTEILGAIRRGRK